MIFWLLLAVGIGILYMMWFFSLSSWRRLTELGVEHALSFISFFDGLVISGITALVLSRLIWILTNLAVFQDVPWGILPYLHTANGLMWFSVFPWRFLVFTEGLNYTVLWAVYGVLAAIITFIPTIALSRKLKVEKLGIMRGYIIRAIGGMIVVLLYTGVLVYIVK